MKPFIYPLICIIFILSNSSLEASSKIISKYTNEKNFTIVKRDISRDKDRKIIISNKLYKGLGGYSYEILAGGDQLSIRFYYKGKVAGQISDGMGSFAKRTETPIEWRGIYKKGKFIPLSLIFRTIGEVYQDKGDILWKRKNHLVVCKVLNGKVTFEKSFIQKNMNQISRKLADSIVLDSISKIK